MRKIIISIIAAMLVIPFAAGCAATQGYACTKHVTVTGTLRMVGSEPMTELILETKDNKEVYEITGDKKKELSAKQGYEVTVSGGLVKATGITAKKAVQVENYKINNQ